MAQIGDVGDPIKAGNSLRLAVNVYTQSGTVADITGFSSLEYALFAMIGDMPVGSPSFVLTAPNDISVVNQTLGQLDVFLTNSTSSLLSGRDWGVLRMINPSGVYDLFDGPVVSTIALSF